MLLTFSILFLYQLAGQLIVGVIDMPVPGPVIGMILLFITLIAYPKLLDKMEHTANDLLRHLSLLFVPAGVGVMAAGELLSHQWLAIALTIVGSSLLTLGAVAAITAMGMARTQKRPSATTVSDHE